MNPPLHLTQEGHLSALGALLERSFPDPAGFFDHGLALLVEQLNAPCALIARPGEEGVEASWCHCPNEELREALHTGLVDAIIRLALAHPRRPQVIHDLHEQEEISITQADPRRRLRSLAATVLWQDEQPDAVLMVLDREPRRFLRHEVALLAAVGDLFARTLEVEHLKYQLRVTRDALDLATAIVEDSAFESPASGLPSAHYLEIWLKVNLFLARRRFETMAVVGWRQEPALELLERLRSFAETLRGEDLLVDMGQGDFLLLLPHTGIEGAGRPLERLREVTGPVPVGATLWDPKQTEDRDDTTFLSTRARVQTALSSSRQAALGGEAWVCWHPPQGSPASTLTRREPGPAPD